jgi:hypothetical protein
VALVVRIALITQKDSDDPMLPRPDRLRRRR